ncbi:bifunctional folylpolyglutamate synthase/dihydrofolate synthase [Candidatus Woesearchaeota archaeon]|nr:bifunctional folylpolyglutamate synthase/dihydrofolate synthase [Candidatus Woesearchaeota archaeon]
MNYQQATAWLETLEKENTLEREWNLDTTRALLKKLKHPEKKLGTILHVTGTNGKGSVCAMLAKILHVAGYTVGLYTSPHISRITERIRMNNQEISKNDFACLVDRVRPFVTTESFFEVMTVLGFLYFADNHVDFSVIEVGLGGRLDSTNVVQSTLSVITNISLEHTQRLGKSEQEIAREKAGIIKENSICVTAATGEALSVIQEVCKEKNTELVYAKPTDAYDLSLQGEMQKENAGVVIAALEALKKKEIMIAKVHIAEGLRTTTWHGRLEFIEQNVLVDVAHNPGGMSQLAKELRKLKDERDYKRIIIVVGILADKEWKLMLDQVVPVAGIIIATKPNSHRALEPAQIQRYLEKEYGMDAEVVEAVPAALERAKRISGKQDLIVVTGSFYTVGEIYR